VAVRSRGDAETRADELIYWRFGNAEPTPRSVDLEEAPDAGVKR
jgi:hypothetical protein